MILRMVLIVGMALCWQTVFYWQTVTHAHPPTSFALRSLSEQVAESPDRPDLLQRRARLLLASGDRVGAMEDLHRSRSLGGDPFEIDMLEAEVRLANGQLSEALESTIEALRREPDHAGGRRLKGRILLAMGRSDDAVRELAAAYAASARRTPELLLELVGAYEAAGQSNVALLALDRGIAEFGSLTVLQRRALVIEYCGSGSLRDGARLAAIENPWQRRILEAEALALLGRSEVAKALFDGISSDLADESESRLALRWQRRVDEGLADLENADAAVQGPGCGAGLQ